MLHLVDLDGAFEGHSANLDVIAAIRQAIALPIELGGGIRTLADIDHRLKLGIDSVIVGTMAVRDAEALRQALARHGAARIQLGIDARDGKVAVHGWTEETPLDAAAFARHWRMLGIQRVIFTDIARDGMLMGPNIDAVRAFAKESGVRVTASGGVASAADIARLAELEPLGVDRAIVGKALYEGRIRLEEIF
jgi:phosphoribosylformimino-5-aminoimidazole carboxamide ribotide isomerase